MEEYKKGSLIAEGKTKKIFSVDGVSDLAIVQYKDTITKFDDPDLTREFKMKAEYSNITTCKVFEYLKELGFQVAFFSKISRIEFLAPICLMLPFEVVTRRFAYGSYLKRNPEMIRPEGEKPERFRDIVVEFFLKTTKGKLVSSKGKVIVEGLEPKKGEEDPFIVNPYDEFWVLHHPKKPANDEHVELRKGIIASDIIDEPVMMGKMANSARDVFLALEMAWEELGCQLIDMKIEFGISPQGELLIADVIDNDSWRLRDENWRELSKESFRQNEELSVVKEKYELVASLVKKILK